MSVKRVAALVAVVCLAVTPGAQAQEPPTADQIARFTAAAKPGPEHERLAVLEGEWDLVIRSWLEPGGDAIESRGRAENRMMLGGRFLESRSTLEIMGTAAESRSILGFDRRTDEYTIILLDTEGTYWVTGSGTALSDGRIVMSGTDEDPILGHTQIYDVVVRIESRDRYVMEVIFRDEMHTRGGEPYRAIEVVSTRRRS